MLKCVLKTSYETRVRSQRHVFLSGGVHDQNKNKSGLPATRFSGKTAQKAKARFKAVLESGGNAKSNRDLDDGCLATVEED